MEEDTPSPLPYLSSPASSATIPPMPKPPNVLPPANAQKTRTGLNRVWHAAGYSLEGLRAAWNEVAFRQEALACAVLIPLAFWLGRSWVETSLLAGSAFVVMIVELLNTGI